MQDATTRAYLDFEVEIGEGNGLEYPIKVIRSPAGEARETLTLPFDEGSLEIYLKDLQIALLRSGWQLREVLSPQEQTVQSFGTSLFNSLFTGEVRSRFDMSHREAAQQNKGLRVKLRIQAPELAALPWEFLYDARHADYVCLSRNTPLVRYLELPQAIQPIIITPPLRILGMISGPRDQALLNTGREKQRVEEALRILVANGLATLTWIEGQTWRDLQTTIRSGVWHIFHFIGHGGFDHNSGQGFILLADEEGYSHRLGATQFGRLLADSALRMVLLNSCEQARINNRDVFSSTAATLVRRGIPAVLAMQYPISDWAAIEFSQAFYAALAEGIPVDATVAEARKTLSLAVPNSLEWGTPVLYMRSPDGILFNVKRVNKTKRAPLHTEEETTKAELAPLPELSQQERKRLLEIEQQIGKYVFGQDTVIQSIAKVLRRSYTGLRDPNRPIGSFLFAGTSGVGKTLLARSIAKYIFGNDRNLIELKASEFTEQHSISRLVGPPHGYVGYEGRGQLAEALYQNPDCVLFINEIEKFHSAIGDMILGIMENGYINDTKGKKIDFSRSIIILETRVAQSYFGERSGIGTFSKTTEDPVTVKLMKVVKSRFSPEFLEHIDQILIFEPLGREQLLKIVEVELERLAVKLRRRGIDLTCTDIAKGVLADKSFSQSSGARHIHRIVQEYLEDPLTEGYIGGQIREGHTVVVDFDVSKGVFTLGGVALN